MVFTNVYIVICGPISRQRPKYAHATIEKVGSRKLHNKELLNLYSSPSIIRMVKSRRTGLAGHVARMGEKRNAYRILVGKPEGKRPLGSQRHRWVDNIKMDLRGIEWDGMDWIDLAQDSDQCRALVNTVMNHQVP
jgi:hypothetical protein